MEKEFTLILIFISVVLCCLWLECRKIEEEVHTPAQQKEFRRGVGY